MENKLCIKCKTEKPLTEFRFKNKEKGWYHSYCKECNKGYSTKHYNQNKDEYLKRTKETNLKTRTEYRKRIVEYFKEHPCVDCGETDFVVLDFDHVRGNKKNNVATMIHRCYSWEKIENEIAKCEVRCANCHRRKTAKQFGWYSTYDDN